MNQPVDVKPFTGTVKNSAPTIFSDGVASAANTKEIIKIIFFRTDPNADGVSTYENVAACQIVMPVSSFVSSYAFMGKYVELLVETGVITQDVVDDIIRNA